MRRAYGCQDSPGCREDFGNLLLSPDPSGRFFVNQAGRPFQVRGDSAWSISVRLTPAQVIQYLDDRKARGFNSIILQACDSGVYGGPNNYAGQAAYTDAIFTLNAPFWALIDFIFAEAAKRGIVCFFLPLYFGFAGGSEGWYAPAVSAGATAVFNYGAVLGARYVNQDNIVWVNAGDYKPPNLTIANALANGIRSTDTRHQWSVHWDRDSTGTDLVAGAQVAQLSLSSSYTSQANVSSRVATDYTNHTSGFLTFLIESVYEGTFGATTLTGQETAREAYQAFLNGACGGFYGNHTVWQYLTGWQAALGSSGADMQRVLFATMQGVRWWDMAPDLSSQLVTSGRGTIGTVSYVSASLSNSEALIHIPDGVAIGVDKSRMGRPFTATWIDPASGAQSAGGSFSNSGTTTFTPPSAVDTVLQLRAA